MDILPINPFMIDEPLTGDDLLRSLRESHHSGDIAAEANAALRLGNWNVAQSRPADAIACIQLCLVLRRRLQDDAGVAEALLALGLAQRERGRVADAVRCFRDSADTYRTCGDHIGESQALAELRALDDAESRRAA